jgi:hypothetical protein
MEVGEKCLEELRGSHEGKRTLERSERRWSGSFKMDPNDM